MRGLKGFWQDDKGSAYIWMIALITILVSGLMMIGIAEVDDIFFNQVSVTAGVPEAQRYFMHDVITRGFPIGIILVTILWAWTKGQKKAGGDVY